MTKDDVFFLSIDELQSAYRDRSLSPVEVMQAFLDRIDVRNPELNAYIDVFHDASLASARASEARYLSGMPVGLLEGVPVAIKDLLDIAGRRTTAGSTIHRHREAATATSTVVNRLLAAGSLPVGKAQLVEFAYGGWGTNAGMGTPRNPWDKTRHRIPGGSSSGTGVAVAGGLATVGIGTDTGGSVRIPSSYCGLTGLKTTQGRVSNHGVEMVSHTLDTIGPMTWCARDAALVLQAIHGPDPRDAATLGVRPEDFLTTDERGLSGLRFSMDDPARWGSVAPEVAAAAAHVADVIADLGGMRCDSGWEGLDFLADQEETGVIISSEAYSHRKHALSVDAIPGDDASRARILRGASITADSYARAILRRSQGMARVAELFRHVDILILPTTPFASPPLDTIDESDLSPSRLTRFVGYYGLCAVSIPAGLSPEGMPIGIQLVAGPYQEALLLRVANAFQRVTDHHQRRPTM
jgi:aspartyl-tRNA(Asn)/glutamyl-tRNA(Gln) amidotransferase subunit A